MPTIAACSYNRSLEHRCSSQTADRLVGELAPGSSSDASTMAPKLLIWSLAFAMCNQQSFSAPLPDRAPEWKHAADSFLASLTLPPDGFV